MADQYHFVTTWRFHAPVERVWSVVLDIVRYPEWWHDFRRVRISRGDGRSVGSLVECKVRGSLPYSLTYHLEVLEAEQYRHILLRSTGDLVGTGRWCFGPADEGVTNARYLWDVATTKRILNLVAPVARPALARNHERVMANGYAALRPKIEG